MKKILQKLFLLPISFKQTISFSILIHIIVLMFAAYIFRLSVDSAEEKIQSILDFVFEPGIDEINTVAQNLSDKSIQIKNQQEIMKTSKFDKNKLRSQNKASHLNDQEVESNDNQNEDLTVPREFWNPSAEPDKEGLFDVTRSDFINRLKTSNISPRIRFTPKIHSASYSIPEKYQKNIQKKISKFVDKISKETFNDTTFTWKDKDQIFHANISRVLPETSTDLEELIIHITTLEERNNLSTKIKMKRMAFSNFAHFVDFWDPLVVVHDDEIDGRFHSNTNFSISRSKGVLPKFNGKVTTASYELPGASSFPIFNYDDIFTGSFEVGVTEILFPKSLAPISTDSTANRFSIHNIFKETWITFTDDGSYKWKGKSTKSTKNYEIPQNQPHFIIGDKKSKIHLSGILRGKVLVYSKSDIIIDDDLTYAINPKIFEYSNDFLGIVSQKNIEIAHPIYTGWGDLKIFGAICAKNRFRVPNRMKDEGAILYIYGSLSAGSISATEPRYGTKVVFDKRFENQRPPNFPLTDRYEISDWKKKWKVENTKSKTKNK
jgi:hypothetical protein